MEGLINYKELLAKYMAHVGDMEGTDFTSDTYIKQAFQKFTEEEIEILQSL